MLTHSIIQGSPSWHAYRAQHFNASDAPAMLGVSPYKTRTQLLHELHTGLSPEVDAATQRRFDSGHEAEAAARQFSGAKLEPIAKFYEVLEGTTRDETFTVAGRIFGFQLGISCDSKTKRAAAAEAIKELIQQITA